MDSETSDTEFENSRSKSVRLKVTLNKSVMPPTNVLALQFRPSNYPTLRKVLNPKDLALLMQFMEKSGIKDTG